MDQKHCNPYYRECINTFEAQFLLGIWVFELYELQAALVRLLGWVRSQMLSRQRAEANGYIGVSETRRPFGGPPSQGLQHFWIGNCHIAA